MQYADQFSSCVWLLRSSEFSSESTPRHMHIVVCIPALPSCTCTSSCSPSGICRRRAPVRPWMPQGVLSSVARSLQCDFRFDLFFSFSFSFSFLKYFFSFSFVLVLIIFFVLVLVLVFQLFLSFSLVSVLHYFFRFSFRFRFYHVEVTLLQYIAWLIIIIIIVTQWVTLSFAETKVWDLGLRPKTGLRPN